MWKVVEPVSVFSVDVSSERSFVWCAIINVPVTQSDSRLSCYGTQHIKDAQPLIDCDKWREKIVICTTIILTSEKDVLNSCCDRPIVLCERAVQIMTQHKINQLDRSSEALVARHQRTIRKGWFSPGKTVMLFICCLAVLQIIWSSDTDWIAHGRPEANKQWKVDVGDNARLLNSPKHEEM